MNFGRMILLISLFLVAFALRAAHPHAPRGSSDALQQQVVAKEREELDALKAGNHQAFANLIADDAIFLDPRGHGTKAEVVEHTADFQLLDYNMEGIRFVQVSPDSGVVAYKLTQKGSAHGQEFTSAVYASALWTNRDGRWLCLFSQEPPAR